LLTSDPADRAWREVLVAVDVGTSGARAAAFDLDGNRRMEVRRAYPTTFPRPGWAEQDPGAWRAASLFALGRLVRQLGAGRRVLAIGLTGQCPSVVVVDAAHRPIRPGLIYRDNRATEEAAELRLRFGDAAIHRRTGHLPAAFHIVPKLMWLSRHEPEAFERVALALQPRDWVALALTGESATDGSHAAATLAYDLDARAWSPEILGGIDMPFSMWPRLGRSTEVVGTLRGPVADQLGLPRTTPVVLGGADSQACALGAGVVGPGPVSEMAGSSTCLNAAIARPLRSIQVTHYPHVVGEGLTTETGINTTGAAVDWIAALAFTGRSGHGRSTAHARLDAEAAAEPVGSNGVMALPVFGDGERTDPALRGAFVGLSLRHGRGALARAVLEGVAFAIRLQLSLLVDNRVPVTELRISGGDARLATWNVIKADATGLPVTTMPGDASVTGVAMLAGLGAGVYASPDEAIERCVRPGLFIEPDPSTRAAYDDGFEAWRSLAASSIVRTRVAA
jgi:sugar (pentulose or hexulose) kinase